MADETKKQLSKLKEELSDMERQRNYWRDLVDSYKLAAESWRGLYYSLKKEQDA